MKPTSVITAHAEALLRFKGSNINGGGVRWFKDAQVYCDPTNGRTDILTFNDDSSGRVIACYKPGEIILSLFPPWDYPRLVAYLNRLLPEGITVHRSNTDVVLRLRKGRSISYRHNTILWGKPVRVKLPE